MITDVAGVRCGHWTDNDAKTGCTVILLPPTTVGAAEVRGGAPASRELDALGVGRLVDEVHAVVLTGGSAHGLAAADGVMRWCETNGIGFDTGSGVVPIVPSLAIFDLANGDGSVRPGPTEGWAACEAATGARVELGPVGAGTGALVGKWKGESNIKPGGIGASTVRLGALLVSSIVVVNAFGDIDPGRLDAATSQSAQASVDAASATRRSMSDAAVEWLQASLGEPAEEPNGRGPSSSARSKNTTIGLVVTNARLDRVACHLLAQGAHDGLARSIVPPHTRLDGDAFIAAATGQVEVDSIGPFVDVDTVRLMSMVSVERSIRSIRI